MLILCPVPSMSYMEDHVLAYKAPLYGRRTAQFKILPFNFFETCRYFRNFSPSDCALIYGIAGGTPQYLLQMDDSMSVDENIKNTFLNSSSALFEEPEIFSNRKYANHRYITQLSQRLLPELPNYRKSAQKSAKTAAPVLLI